MCVASNGLPITRAEERSGVGFIGLLSGLCLSGKLLSEMQNQIIISRNDRALSNELISICHPTTIRHIPTFYVKTLRRIVTGMQTDAETDLGPPARSDALNFIKQPAANSIPAKMRQHIQVLDLRNAIISHRSIIRIPDQCYVSDERAT